MTVDAINRVNKVNFRFTLNDNALFDLVEEEKEEDVDQVSVEDASGLCVIVDVVDLIELVVV